MRNDANLRARSPRGGSGSFLPTSFRAISTYLRSVSANASSIASSVRSAAVTPASTGALHENDRQREQVQWAGFDTLESGSGETRQVLLLTYLNGFQIWDVEEARNVTELVSRRDGPVSFLRLQPRPYPLESSDSGGIFEGARPLLVVVTGEAGINSSHSPGGFAGTYSAGGIGSPPGGVGSHFIPTIIRFYSLQMHNYVHTLRFRTGIYAVRCSPRVVVVGLLNQIYCFDSTTLQNTFSCVTYPCPPPQPGSITLGFGAVAVGPRLLAYAANQPLITSTGRVSPQHLTPSPGASPSTSPANASLVAHYAKESSKQIAAGIVTLGDMGYKAVSRYCSELLPDGAASPQSGSPSFKSNSNGHSAWQGASSVDSQEYAGMVIVRDLVSKTFVAQFRAHASALSALAFDPSGTLLVSASVYGHNLNIYRLLPSALGNATASTLEANVPFVHLYKLYRGVTSAVIQDISFSKDSQWLSVSSSRGTSHVYAISPFGGTVGPHTHGTIPVDGLMGLTLMPAPAFPWWSSTGPLRLVQQVQPPPPRALTLTVLNRIKNGIGGWRGTVTGAAAAATGRANVLSGAVASMFHDGGWDSPEVEVGNGSLKEQLWVLSPSGHLIRYFLRPSVGGDGGYSASGGPGAGSAGSGSPGHQQELRLVIEAQEKWDVSRRPNWAEREENVESLTGHVVGFEDGVLGTIGGQWGLAAGQIASGGSTGLGKDAMTVEEMQRWFMSNAEVQMHNQARPMPTPTWAKPKVSFHVMLPKYVRSDWNMGADCTGGEIEIERFPTRVIEVRKKDLVPVFERIQVFNKAQGARDIAATETLPSVSGLQMHLHSEDILHDEPSGTVLGGSMRIHRTSSGSSFGSEGVPGTGTLNGFHHNYQDYPELPSAGTPPSSFEASPSFYHHFPPSALPSASGRNITQGALLSPQHVSVDFSQPSYNIEQVTNPDTETEPPIMGPPLELSRPTSMSNSARFSPKRPRGEGDKVLSSFGDLIGNTERVVLLPLEELNIAALENSNGSPGLQNLDWHEHAEVASEPDHCLVEESIAALDLGSVAGEGSSVSTGCNTWDVLTSKRAVSPFLRLASKDNSIQRLEEGSTGLYNHDRHQIETEGLLVHQSPGGMGEDADSVDAHSKSEDNEGGEHRNDWEGNMFPPFDDEDEEN